MDRYCFPLLNGAAAFLIALAMGSGPAAAQQTYEPPAHVAFVDGVAAHEREGTSRAPTPGVPFLPGDRLRSAEGRLEVLFPDGSALHLDEFTEVDLLAPSLLRLNAGRVLLLIVGSENPRDAMTLQVDTAVGSATADGPGEYRVAIRPSVVGQELEFSVYRGWGLIATEQGATELAAGERSIAYEGSRPAGPSRFNAARFDAFDRWSQVRRDSRMVDVISGEYLPENLRSYGAVFNSYGTWEYEQDYGQVWYPRVAVGWRPYYNGYWSSYPAYGWTWVGHDPWGWPTHHYGRWGYARSRWFWMPDPYWGPGWVSWAYAPGYAAWCPLGYGNVPVFGLSVGFGGGWGAGWVVTTGAYFSAGVYHTPVHHYAVAPHHLPPPSHFAPRPTPPPTVSPRSAPPAGMQVANNGYVGAPRAGASSRPAASLNQGVSTRGQGQAAGSSFAPRTAPRAGTQSSAGRPVTLGRSRAEAAQSQTGSVDTTRTASPTRRYWSSDAAGSNGASSSTTSRSAPQASRFSRESSDRSAPSTSPTNSRPQVPTLGRSTPSRNPSASSAQEAPAAPEVSSAPVTRGRAASLSAPSQRSAPAGARTHSGLSPTSRIERAPAPSAAPAQAPPASPRPSAPSMRALTPSSSSRSGGGSAPAAAPRFGGSARASAAPATRSSAGSAPSAPRAAAAPRGGSSAASAPAARASSAPAARASSGSGSSNSTGSSSGSGSRSSSGGRFGVRR